MAPSFIHTGVALNIGRAGISGNSFAGILAKGAEGAANGDGMGGLETGADSNSGPRIFDSLERKEGTAGADFSSFRAEGPFKSSSIVRITIFSRPILLGEARPSRAASF